jgi:hypothetical protein
MHARYRLPAFCRFELNGLFSLRRPVIVFLILQRGQKAVPCRARAIAWQV